MEARTSGERDVLGMVNRESIPRQTRSLIRYAFEIKDPHLAQVVRRVEAGEMTIEWLYVD